MGEEAEAKVTPGAGGEVAPVTAPLDRVQPAVRRGDTVRVDVVVRTKKSRTFLSRAARSMPTTPGSN